MQVVLLMTPLMELRIPCQDRHAEKRGALPVTKVGPLRCLIRVVVAVFAPLSLLALPRLRLPRLIHKPSQDYRLAFFYTEYWPLRVAPDWPANTNILSSDRGVGTVRPHWYAWNRFYVLQQNCILPSVLTILLVVPPDLVYVATR